MNVAPWVLIVVALIGGAFGMITPVVVLYVGARIDRQTKVLEDLRRTAVDTHALANSANALLQEQKEALQDRLDKANKELGDRIAGDIARETAAAVDKGVQAITKVVVQNGH
jgi:type II secretory pathway pseudopilin PulG